VSQQRDPAGRLHGILVPLVTPLNADESVDLASLGRLIDSVLDAGAHGLWLLGTSGEFAGLPAGQRRAAVEFAVQHVGDRAPLVVNVGDGSTKLAAEHARHAAAVGVRYIAATTPHYYLHSMDEVAAHFTAVKAAAPEVDLFVYNIPSTVKVRITVATVLGLAAEGVVQGIKDTQNDLQWDRELVNGLRERGLDRDFVTFVGTRSLIDASVFVGADGAIPATSNIAPAACVAAYEAARAGDPVAAAQAQHLVLRYESLARVAGGGSTIAADLSAMKHVLRLRGVIDDATTTAPLRPFTDDEVSELASRLAALDGDLAPEAAGDQPSHRKEIHAVR
jgi:4-hydroxy-tetrahydrodipicolinate synthase